jgi:hypothetical protein
MITNILQHVNWLAVLVAGVGASALLGFLWYGPLFGKMWMRASGVNPDGRNMAPLLALSILLSIIAATLLAVWIGYNGPLKGAAKGLLAGAVFGGGALGTSYLWEGRSLKLWLINAGYVTGQYGLIGLILGLWH